MRIIKMMPPPQNTNSIFQSVENDYLEFYYSELAYEANLLEDKTNYIELKAVKNIFSECFKSSESTRFHKFNAKMGDSIPGTLVYRAKELAIVYFDFKNFIDDVKRVDTYIPSGDDKFDKLFVAYNLYLNDKILINVLFETTQEMRSEWNKLSLQKNYSRIYEWRTNFSVIDLMISHINQQVSKVQKKLPSSKSNVPIQKVIRPLNTKMATPCKVIAPELKSSEDEQSDYRTGYFDRISWGTNENINFLEQPAIECVGLSDVDEMTNLFGKINLS